ncbi:uncharacterized protein LOC135120973 [Zophobas morio]|jgi:hypothetical protein|uniref:uncharacterized protein LOC135120973 n=1 Tax=Zophobas morio TaxID=2755281 RepID=UPI003082A513
MLLVIKKYKKFSIKPTQAVLVKGFLSSKSGAGSPFDLHDAEVISLVKEPYNALSCRSYEEKVVNIKSRVKTPQSLLKYAFDKFPYPVDKLLFDQLKLSTISFLSTDLYKLPKSTSFNGVISFESKASLPTLFLEESLVKALAVFANANFLAIDSWDMYDWDKWEGAHRKALEKQKKDPSVSLGSPDLPPPSTLPPPSASLPQPTCSLPLLPPISGANIPAAAAVALPFPVPVSTEGLEAVHVDPAKAIGDLHLKSESKEEPLFPKSKEGKPRPPHIYERRTRKHKNVTVNAFPIVQVDRLPDLFNIIQKLNGAKSIYSPQVDSTYEWITKILEVATGNENEGQPLVVFVRNFHTTLNVSKLLMKISKIRETTPLALVGSSEIFRSRHLSEEEAEDEGGFPRPANSKPVEPRMLELRTFAFGVPWVTLAIEDPKVPSAKDAWTKILLNDRFLLALRHNHFQFAKVLRSMSVASQNYWTVDKVQKIILSLADAEKIIGWGTTLELIEKSTQDDVNSSKPLTLSPASLQKAVDLYYSQLNAEACSPEKPSSLSAAQLRDGASSFPLEKAFPRTAHNAFSPPAELNTYETALVPNLYSPGAVGIKYSDIGSHDSLKEMLYELVTLPIQRQELFKRGLLAKSISGILLFGPPGTGKTLLAKALAAESGCHFLYIKLSNLLNMFIGESEKNAKAVFSLAHKYAPCIIFMDEVDSIFSRRTSDERNPIKRDVLNELMSEWDGITTGDSRVIVVGATNRPYDLDDAVLRRLPRRLLVDVPNLEARIQILNVLLRDEILCETVSIERLAEMTHGFTGSDLKNMCLSAAMLSVKEFLSLEKQLNPPEAPVITFDNFVKARATSKSSISEHSFSITKLREWNIQYGMGGDKSKKYFGFQSPTVESTENKDYQKLKSSSKKGDFFSLNNNSNAKK